MKYLHDIVKLFIVIVGFTFVSCSGNAQQEMKTTVTETSYPVTKSDAEWQAQLTDMEYYVLREAGTERAFTGEYDKHYEEGTYHCSGCGNALYKGENKFDSGTGWPSWDQAIEGGVAYDTDQKLGYTRTEVHCANCGGHLGHVFNDGPRKTTGKRHCINSVSLKFKPKN